MLPPECSICNHPVKPFSKKEGIIYFHKTEKDIEWDRLMEEKEMTGHPPYAAWFCRKHYKKALVLKDRSLTEVLKEFKK